MKDGYWRKRHERHYAHSIATASSQLWKWKVIKSAESQWHSIQFRSTPVRIHFNQFKWWRLLCKRLILNSLHSCALVTCQHVASMNRASIVCNGKSPEWMKPLPCTERCECVWCTLHVCTSKSQKFWKANTCTSCVCARRTRTLLKMTKSVHYSEFVVANARCVCVCMFKWDTMMRWWWSGASGRTLAQNTKHICRMKNGKRK